MGFLNTGLSQNHPILQEDGLKQQAYLGRKVNESYSAPYYHMNNLSDGKLNVWQQNYAHYECDYVIRQKINYIGQFSYKPAKC